jgi:hypothetical protein
VHMMVVSCETQSRYQSIHDYRWRALGFHRSRFLEFAFSHYNKSQCIESCTKAVV